MSGGKYFINNPANTILLIQKLCGGTIEQAIGDIVKNFIANKEFERARKICESFSSSVTESARLYIADLMKKIKMAETTDIILKGIKGQANQKEQEEYYKIIGQELEMEKATRTIRLENINLGTSKDGRKKIIFADVWSDERLISFNR